MMSFHPGVLDGKGKISIYFQFISINSLYMFLVLICSSAEGTVYSTIGIFFVGTMLAGS
jgi:hypothetical protein